MVGAGIAATQALRRAGIEVDLDGTSEAERRFAEQFRDGEFVQVGGPGLAVSAADGGQVGVVIARMGADFGDDVSTVDAARERARFFVRNLVEPRVHHVVQRALWEEGNPFVWTIGDIEPLPRFDAGRVTASPTLTG